MPETKDRCKKCRIIFSASDISTTEIKDCLLNISNQTCLMEKIVIKQPTTLNTNFLGPTTFTWNWLCDVFPKHYIMYIIEWCIFNRFCFRVLTPIAAPKYACLCTVYILDAVDIMEQDAKVMLIKVQNMFLNTLLLVQVHPGAAKWLTAMPCFKELSIIFG